MSFIRQAWYAAGWSHEITAKPLGRQLLGQRLAFFRDAQGVARALDAACPHRGADMSTGVVVDGCLQCPYHGWAFASDGQCTSIPGQMRIPSNARVAAHRVVEQDGILWYYPGVGEPTAPPPRLEVPERDVIRMALRPRLCGVGFTQLVEQSIDTTHTPFVHAGSLGKKQRLDTVRFEAVVDADERGFGWVDNAPAKSGKEGWRALVQRKVLGIDIVRRTFRYEMPGAAYLHVEHANGGFDVTTFLMTPATDDQSWFFAETKRTHSRDPLSALAHRYWLEQVIAEDMRIAQIILVKDDGLELPGVSSAGDSITLVFRKLYRRWLLAEQGAQGRVSAVGAVR